MIEATLVAMYGVDEGDPDSSPCDGHGGAPVSDPGAIYVHVLVETDEEEARCQEAVDGKDTVLLRTSIGELVDDLLYEFVVKGRAPTTAESAMLRAVSETLRRAARRIQRVTTHV